MEKHIHGGNIYEHEGCLDFSANCNPLGTPLSVQRAAVKSIEQIAHYPQVGCVPLRAAIAEYEAVRPEQVICGNGAAELIFSLCQALKPRKALLLAPTFAEYGQALSSVGCQITCARLREEDGFAVGEEFLDLLQEDLDIVFLCNPNNPTGALTDRSLLLRILERCETRGIFLAVDECFLDFVKTPSEYTLKGELEKSRGLFLLKAFTKRYAMAGLRLGYGLCENKELLEQMAAMVQPWNVSVPAQAAGLAALQEEDYVRRARALIFREREWMVEQFTALGLTVYPPQANYIFFKGPEALFSLCEKRGVLIRDCGNYPGLCKGYFRVAVRTHEENELLVKALTESFMEIQKEG
ncbi:pyridoxal phosphate-dependent aminotransferase [Parablautia sp. Marseille-Q6255]|uniref:pyridoxal phosphate-dependent aminotransferase n=1 Tax=Parablautia sp. Marseille-Q6255 TaxID=3039593 RepID=UPI0024BC250B|nr:pyridoxal phosphate-dependent class II aminotransferase [Parablautia sp. Marseille-Q6255]